MLLDDDDGDDDDDDDDHHHHHDDDDDLGAIEVDVADVSGDEYVLAGACSDLPL